ncbi:MFS transporter [Anaerosolibacter sp.]|uniref:MFS transporter n=1 Tax=Anaerosolibacter sp. TaxID=1872527 RepID=UPI00262DE0F5|nr:MFS transporter [Anaerosolibacter sp.]
MLNKKTLFCIVTGLFWFSMYAYIPQMTNYAKEMGASYKMIGIIASAYGFSQTILRIPLGIVSDALNKRKIFITLGLLIIILSTLSVFALPNTYTLLLARLLAGVAAATWINYTVMFSSYYESSQVSKAMGIINATNKAGQFAAVLAGGFVSLYLGVRYLFLLSAIGGAVGFILSLSIWEEKSMTGKKPFQLSAMLSMISNKDIIHVSVLAIFSQVITYSTAFGFTPLVASNLGASNFQLSMLAIFFNFPQIVFAALSGIVFVKYLGEKTTLLIGFGISSVLCMLTPFSLSLKMLYTLQIISGIANAVTFPLLMGLAIHNVASDSRTTIMGFFQAMYGIGMIIGPILMGSIGDQFGLTMGFFVTGLFGIAAMVSIAFVGVHDSRKILSKAGN